MNEQENIIILKEFEEKLIKNQKPLEKEIVDMVNEDFWELI